MAAAEAVEFEVGAKGAPTLQEEGAPDPVDQAAAGAEAAPAAGVIGAWTPAEVSSALQQYWNLGCLWFGPSWQARDVELADVSVLMTPWFDRWFPRDGASDPGLVVLVLACAGTALTMVLSRSGEIAKHWREPWIKGQLAQLQAARPAPAAAGAPPQQPASEANGAGAAAGAASYHLPRDLARVVAGGEPDQALAGLGM